uniref:Uncharacterized protein n=1 Tax=Neobodo designis TaxID=312471 RepID=A0A7S1L871_NEODS
MITARDPKVLDLVTWGVASGAKLFRQVRVTDDARLVASAHIPQYDFALAVPAKLAFTILDIARAPNVPPGLRVSASNYSAPVQWFPGVNWGMFAYTVFCTKTALTANEPGRSAQMALIGEYCSSDDAWLTDAAMRATQSDHFQSLTQSVVDELKAPRTTFDESFALMYCGLRRSAVPVWSGAARTGPQFFAASAYGTKAPRAGDVLGSVPFIDLARHSSRPSCAVGMPDPQMLEYLVSELGAQANTDYFVLQTTRAIMPGEEITVDRNASLGLKPEDFAVWMGRPWCDDAARSAAASNSKPGPEAPAGVVMPAEVDPDDLFF